MIFHRSRDVQWCDACKRATQLLARGGCSVCRRRERAGLRRAKLGSLPPLVHHSSLRSVCWDLYSVLLRATHTSCEMCQTPGPPEMFQGAHGWTRQARGIMFDERNIFHLCSHCHRKHTPGGPAWYRWMRERLGQDVYDALEWQSDHGPKLTTPTLQLLLLDYQLRIKALPEGERKTWAEARVVKVMERVAGWGVRVA
jgi:hypothetical protein